MSDNAPSTNRPAAHGTRLPRLASLKTTAPGSAPDVVRRIIAEADRCVLCGLCLPQCPTYRKTGDENESPRGRIALMRALASGALLTSERLTSHLSLCLGCRACERSCPSGVKYGWLIEAGRNLIQTQQPLSWRVRFGLALSVRPRLLTAIGSALRGYQRSGLQRSLRASGVLRLLRVQRLESLLPTLPAQLPRQKFHAAHGTRRGRVALFLGCVARVLDADTLVTAIRLLTRLGYDVVIPETQTCCGALLREAGQSERAQILARQNRTAFQAAGIDTVITVASGCGVVLANSGNQNTLGTDRSIRILDIHQFLADITLPESMMLAPLPIDIAVQDPCSLRNALHAEQSVYALLERIPAARILPLAENYLCCGGAGAYPLRHTAMAGLLRADKLAHLSKHQPAILATANIGCALHLRAGLRAQGQHIEVLHPIVIFDRQLRERTT